MKTVEMQNDMETHGRNTSLTWGAWWREKSLHRKWFQSLEGWVEASQEKELGRGKHSRQREQHRRRLRDETEHDTLVDFN